MSDPAIVQRLVTQLATFLRALHGIPTDQIADMLPPTDWRRLWSDLEEQMRAALFPYVSPATQERITATFAAFFDDPRNFAFTPTVIHGDFGTGNLFFDPYKGAMTGVIDFGSATLGDPATMSPPCSPTANRSCGRGRRLPGDGGDAAPCPLLPPHLPAPGCPLWRRTQRRGRPRRGHCAVHARIATGDIKELPT